MNPRSRLNVTTTQRMALNTGLVTAIQTLRADALGLTRYLEEAAAANPALILQVPLLQPYEWLPRWTQAFSGAIGQDMLAAASPSLMSHVMAFVEGSVPPADRTLAITLAEALEPSGWLGRPVMALASEAGVTEDAAERVLAQLQRIEPRGLFARNLMECLQLQAAEAGILDAAMRVILQHLDLLARADFARLARLAKVPEAEIMARFRLIRSLDPKPGAAFAQAAAPVREPDLMAKRQDDGWQIALNQSSLPALSLSGDRSLGKRAEARAVIALVNARNQTLLKVGQEVMLRQWRALEDGLGALAPMRMADVAQSMGLHESTISRVVAGTSVDTPHGTWWLRDLFSRDMGDGLSAVALRNRLQGLIAQESGANPLSDETLALALSDGGPIIARRTVAKYRMQLKIPAAHARRIKTHRKPAPKG
jgi:RNA polymerase sigma-54 factor